MVETKSDQDSELAAIAASGAIFSALDDADARRRVLSYVLDRFLPDAALVQGQHLAAQLVEPAERELPGIARLTSDGQFQMTLSELKARSRLQAAVRLAMIAIYAHQRLTGRPLSSRQFLTPLLKEWHLYDGNTRARIAREQGVIRNGDDLSLEGAARREAERFISERHSTIDLDKRSQRFHRFGSEPIRVRTSESGRGTVTAVYDHIENWDNFTNKCSVGIHTVDKDGVVLWANRTELNLLGYEHEEYIGRFIGDFHVDDDDVENILGILARFETVKNFPARMRAKDGSNKFVMINSNVYRQTGGEFGHSRCFTTEIDEAVWKTLKEREGCA